MLNYNKVLTLVIPTYNRSSHLDTQIAWAVDSIDNRWEKIELIICDNASTDDTAAICEKWSRLLEDNLQVFRNPENVGLVKNCILGIERASGDFVWLVGDDDPISDTAVSTVLDILQTHMSLNIIHINHRCISGINGSVIIDRFYKISHDIDEYSNPSTHVSNILKSCDTGGFMFVTASVVNRKVALSFIEANPPEESSLLAYPMFLNVGLASSGPFYLIAQCLIDCVYETSSWLDKQQEVRYEQVPKTLLKLKKFGVSNEALLHCLNFQFLDFPSFRDLLYRIRKNPKYARQINYTAWLRRWRIKDTLVDEFK